jgi:hypothetical protein
MVGNQSNNRVCECINTDLRFSFALFLFDGSTMNYESTAKIIQVWHDIESNHYHNANHMVLVLDIGTIVIGNANAQYVLDVGHHVPNLQGCYNHIEAFVTDLLSFYPTVQIYNVYVDIECERPKKRMRYM